MLNSSDKANTMQAHTAQPQSNLNVHTIVEPPNQERDMSNCVLLSLFN